MKTMKKEMIIKGIIIMVFLLLVPMLAAANGTAERPYGNLLDEEFTALADDVQSGKIDVETAVARLHEFRIENGREDKEDYQVMEKLLAQVRTKEMTMLQARLQLQQLEECKAELTPNQLQQREKNMSQLKIQNSTQTQTQTQTQAQTGTQTQAKTGSTGSTGGSTDKTKSKK